MCSMPAKPRASSRWNDTADRLAARFWPGPLTLVLPRAKRLARRAADDGRARHRRDPRAGASDGAGADPRRRPADRRTLGQPQRRRQPDPRRACRRIAGRARADDPRWRALRRRARIDGARPHDASADAAAPGRRHARGDRGGDRPDRAQRRPARRATPRANRPASSRATTPRPGRCGSTRRSVAADEGLLASGPMPPGARAHPQSQPRAATSPRRPPTCLPCCARSTGRTSAASRSCPFRKRDWALRSTTACAAPPTDDGTGRQR